MFLDVRKSRTLCAYAIAYVIQNPCSKIQSCITFCEINIYIILIYIYNTVQNIFLKCEVCAIIECCLCGTILVPYVEATYKQRLCR